MPEFEYIPEGWCAGDSSITGWNEESIGRAQEKDWHDFVKSLEGTDALGVTHECGVLKKADCSAHNTMMCYAYVLTLAARKKDRIKVLDWGGGAGHYYVISKALLPDVHIDYHCYDVPLLCKIGQNLLPDASFYEEAENVLEKKYDLVLVSGSLQYFKDWQEVIRKLASVSGEFLYVTRLPVVNKVSSYVVAQAPSSYYRGSKFLGWSLNREEFLKCVLGAGLLLVREFLIDERPFVPEAPEQWEYRGFLFRFNDSSK